MKADKSKNIYQTPVDEYNEIPQENITADYEKCENQRRSKDFESY